MKKKPKKALAVLPEPEKKPDKSFESLAKDVEKTNPSFIEHLRKRGLVRGKK
jgi:hypothetical protein